MTDQRIEPSKVRTPIQLLAAWLVGLIVVNGSFLTAAASIARPNWASGALVVSAIVDVPLFLIAIFLLQTRFRPEMQEDEYYSQYLERRFSQETGRSEIVAKEQPLEGLIRPSALSSEQPQEPVQNRRNSLRARALFSRILVNDLLPRYQELAIGLRNAGIDFDTFGSSSNRAQAPSNFIIAIGDGFEDIETLRRVIFVSRPLGLGGIALSGQIGSRDRLLIGAYTFSDNQRPYLEVGSDHFEKIIRDDSLWSDVVELVPRSAKSNPFTKRSTLPPSASSS